MSNEDLNTEMDGESLDIADQRKRELAQLFPGAFTETVNNEGELVFSVDFNKLKAELGDFTDVYENHRERYGMEWPGKKEALKLIQEPSRATLKPCREESVDFDNTENLFIEGDNLEVLKLLQKSYYGKVKMIYIDPPYNTGKEFIYPDKYSENLETYLAYAGLVDDEGKKFTTNTASEGRFHTKWLNMMYPRLYLARNLLRKDGMIFISIDDNEVENLCRLCDEIFGEELRLGTFVWKRRQNADNRNQTRVSVDHEYVLLYGKTDNVSLNGVSIDTSKYKNPDNDSRGDWASIDLTGLANKSQRPNLHYDIVDPTTGLSYPPNPNRGWSKSKSVVDDMISEGRVLFPSKPEGRPREKKFLNDLNSLTTGYSTVLNSTKVGYTTNGTREVRALLQGNYFDFPKPINLLRQLIEQATGDEDIILDFFAGSGTLADSVYHQSIDDGKKRKYILVQLPEKVEEDSAAHNAGYKTIADIAKLRLRLAADSIQDKNNEQLGFIDISEFDLGYKVLKLDQSNFSKWHTPIDMEIDDVVKQLELHIDHIEDSSAQEYILYELLLKSGFLPTEKVKKLELEGSKVFSIAEDALLICLEDDISAELINAIVDIEPLQFICLDKAFHGNDQLKANTVQTFASLNQGRDKSERIEFRTV